MKKRTQREERQKRQGLPYGLLILAMLIFGTNGLLVSRISVQSSQIVLLRTLIGGALLSVIVLLRGGFDRSAVRADLPMLLLGGTALGLNWVALFGAYRLLNVSLATLIYYIGPILVLLFSPLLFREKLTAVKMAAVIVVAVGLVCISGSILSGGMNLTGLLTAVASALFYAALFLLVPRLEKDRKKIGVMILVVVNALEDQWPLLFMLYDMPLMQAVAICGELLIDIGMRISLIFLGIAVFDYIYQFKKISLSLKSTYYTREIHYLARFCYCSKRCPCNHRVIKSLKPEVYYSICPISWNCCSATNL